SGRHRNCACRGRRDHAIFWCEHWRNLLANLVSPPWQGAIAGCATTRRCMKAAAIRNATEVETVARNGESARRRLFDFAELVKARLTLLVLLTTAAGFYLGAQSPINYAALFHVVFGTAAAAAGAAALNQWWERKLDALMRRTRTRPVPAGRMRPAEALTLGVALSVLGVSYLAATGNALSATLAALTIVIYLFGYTPLKRACTANTVVGAIPGAVPPMIGWVAARGAIEAGAWSLFAILF